MPELKDVLDDVQREVKKFGEDVKGLHTSMQRDLKEVRELAEKAGKNAGDGTQLKADLKALTEGVAAKHEAIEKTVKDIEEKALKGAEKRLEEIEKKLNRQRLGGSGAEADQADIEHARTFHKCVLASRGELKVNTDVSDDKINFDEIKSYRSAFAYYARKGDRDQTFDAKSMSVGSNPDGGYFVTPFMSPRILSIVYESSPMRQLATVETISSDAVEYPVDDGEESGGWVGEQETRPETATAQVGIQRIPVHELYANPRATQKLLEDASIDVEAWLARKIGEKFGRLEATAFVTGNGVKRPRGFTTYPSGTARGQVEQVVSGNATLLTFDGLINLTVALKEPYVAGASWAMRRATVGAVMLFKDGNGQYIWRTDNQAGKPSVLLGHPVSQFADMAAVGGAALPVAFGNFRAAYTIVDRLGISTLRDNLTAKPFVQFYTRRRLGGDLTNFEALKLQVVST